MAQFCQDIDKGLIVKTYVMKLMGSAALAATLVLAACGGGGELAACGSGNATVNLILDQGKCSTSSGTVIGATSGTTASATASLALTLTDASGVLVTSVSPERNASVNVVLKNSRGAVVPNAVVTFSTSDKTGTFVPSSGTALTDANGMASVALGAGQQAGAFSLSANATASGVSATATAGYMVVFPTLSLSALSLSPATLSAGGNASVSVSVSSGTAPYAAPLSVAFSSPCVAAGKASIGSPVLTQNGLATASYTDKGCGVADLITAAVTLGGATVSQTGTLTVLPASAGSVKFVSADTTNIALKGTGGFGRQEFSTLKFQVFDTTGSVVAGKLVDFGFADKNSSVTTALGGLTLFPAAATSDTDGTVTTLVSGGTITTSVRVVATVHASSPAITSLSNVLVVSTGVPDQRHFSLSTQTGNCEGLDFDQVCSVLTATLGDHFGNRAPDGTAVNFSAEGGVIDASCVTGAMPASGATPSGQSTNSQTGPGSGTCSVTLRASNPRPANGRVTVLAYVAGEEDLVDTNGNNVYDSGDSYADKSPDIFRDDNESGNWTAGEPCVGPNSNGTCSTPGDGQYNGVLRMPQAPSAQTLYVSGQLVQLFSGSHANVSFTPAAISCTVGGTADVQVRVTDEIGNVMPAGTTIAFSTFFGFGVAATSVFPASVTVNNVVLGVGEPLLIPTYNVTVACAGSGKLFATVTTPAKVETAASVPIN